MTGPITRWDLVRVNQLVHEYIYKGIQIVCQSLYKGKGTKSGLNKWFQYNTTDDLGLKKQLNELIPAKTPIPGFIQLLIRHKETKKILTKLTIQVTACLDDRNRDLARLYKRMTIQNKALYCYCLNMPLSFFTKQHPDQDLEMSLSLKSTEEKGKQLDQVFQLDTIVVQTEAINIVVESLPLSSFPLSRSRSASVTTPTRSAPIPIASHKKGEDEQVPKSLYGVEVIQDFFSPIVVSSPSPGLRPILAMQSSMTSLDLLSGTTPPKIEIKKEKVNKTLEKKQVSILSTMLQMNASHPYDAFSSPHKSASSTDESLGAFIRFLDEAKNYQLFQDCPKVSLPKLFSDLDSLTRTHARLALRFNRSR